MRKLVTIRKVDEIRPIMGADCIETAIIDGWTCVVQKGTFKVGDHGVFFEIDSLLPLDNQAFAFLNTINATCSEKKTFPDGRPGYRLRTKKIRNQLSQGLFLPLSCLEKIDLSTLFDVLIYEPDESKSVLYQTGLKKFPAQISPTEQERIQNIPLSLVNGRFFEVTEKLDGTSCSCYNIDGVVGMCSRRFDITDTLQTSHPNGPYKYIWEHYHLATQLASFQNIVLQGEIVGPKVQKNPL